MKAPLPNFNHLVLGLSTYERTSQGFHYHKAYHPNLWEMWVVSHGRSTIGLPAGRLDVGKHKGILIPPTVPHERWVDDPEGCVALVTHFKITWPKLHEISQNVLDLTPRALWHLRDFLNVRSDMPFDGIRRRQFWSLLLLELVSPVGEDLLRPSPLESLGLGLGDELVTRGIEHMHTDLAGSLDLGELERITGYGRRRLRDVFHTHTGMSLREALMRLRLEEAKRLLVHSPFKIRAIAAMVGFRHARRFNEFFKRRAGCTPREFARIGRGPESGFIFESRLGATSKEVQEITIRDASDLPESTDQTTGTSP